MAFDDWDSFVLNGTTGLDIASPLIDAGSLKFDNVAISRVQYQLDGGQSRGFTKGKIRTIMRSVAANAVTDNICGLFCLSSQENIHTTAGGFYGVGVEPRATAGNVILKKATSGGLSSWAGLGSLGTGTKDFSVATTIALELEWDIGPGFGGTKLTVRVGDMTDFSDLSDVIDLVDISSPHTTGFAEGIISHTPAGVTSEYLVDNTVIFSGS